jgi:hypothetical protein
MALERLIRRVLLLMRCWDPAILRRIAALELFALCAAAQPDDARFHQLSTGRGRPYKAVTSRNMSGECCEQGRDSVADLADITLRCN